MEEGPEDELVYIFIYSFCLRMLRLPVLGPFSYFSIRIPRGFLLISVSVMLYCGYFWQNPYCLLLLSPYTR